MALRRWVVLALGCLLLLLPTACSSLADVDPPTLTVQGVGAEVALRPWSYCWGNECADGAPPESPPTVGTADQVQVSSSEVGHSLSAQFATADQDCARVQDVPLGQLGKSLSMWPAGPAGTYDVQLTLRGATGQSASYSFRWTTTRDGLWPVPAASAAVLADNDGTTTSYGVDVAVENLAVTPRQASATLDVTSAEGVTTILRPPRVEPDGGCEPEGSVRFDAPEAEAQAVIASGSAPFRYDVLLVLDGKTYRGTASWPDDQIADFQPSVRLRFRPELPALPRR